MIPVGVTIKKNIIPKIIGDTNVFKTIPILNHILFGKNNILGKTNEKK